MGESGLPRCASDTYQYINRIIENALEQAEQTILKLKTRRDDTVIHAKNKSGTNSGIPDLFQMQFFLAFHVRLLLLEQCLSVYVFVFKI